MSVRKLKAKDLGQISKIVSKMDIKDKIPGLFRDVTGKTQAELKEVETKIAADIIFLILENYWKAEKEFYQFLASVSGKSIKEVEDVEITELVNIVKEIAKDESFSSFFNIVA